MHCLPALSLLLAAAPALDPVPVASPRTDLDHVNAQLLEEALTRVDRRLRRSLTLLESHDSWDRRWRIASDHYVVQTTLPYWIGRELADALEAMLPFYQNILGTSHLPTSPVDVLVFPTIAEYNGFGNTHGGTHSSVYSSFYADQAPGAPIAMVANDNMLALKIWATHSAVHQYLYEAFGPGLDTFVVEGLSAYFSLIYWSDAWAWGQLSELEGTRRYIPLRRLVNEGIDSYASEDTHARLVIQGTFFAYLLHFHPETSIVPEGEEPRQEGFQQFLQGVLRSGAPIAAQPNFRSELERLDGYERDFLEFEYAP